MSIQYPEMPNKITDISKRYIKDFFTDKISKNELTSEDAQKFKKVVIKCIKEAAKLDNPKESKHSAFQKYRKAFVKKYYPSLLIKDEIKNKEDSMVTFLDNL